MCKTSVQTRLSGVRSIRIVSVLLMIFVMSLYPTVARGDSDSWLDWLFTLFSADRVPQRPDLTEEDRVAIEKARVLLQDYAPDSNNRIMLGVLAAALGDANEASARFEEAYDLDTSGQSLLPMTMAAQTFMQQGNYSKAKTLHRKVLQETMERSSPVSQKVNAYLDLAVACSQNEEPDEALANAIEAEELIGKGGLNPDEKTLAYLQTGVVYKEVIQERDAALRVWKKAEALAGSSDSSINARLTVELNLNLLETLPDNALIQPENECLNNLQKAIGQLPDESKAITLIRAGEILVERAVGNNNDTAREQFSSRAKQLLTPVRKMDFKNSNTQMISAKYKAVRAARRLATAENDNDSLKELDKEAKQLGGILTIDRFIPVKRPGRPGIKQPPK